VLFHNVHGGSKLSISSTTIILACSNGECDLEYGLNFQLGATVPEVRSMCPKCNSGSLSVFGIQRGPGRRPSQKNRQREEVRQERVMKHIEKSLILEDELSKTLAEKEMLVTKRKVNYAEMEERIVEAFQGNNSNGGPDILTAFTNRYSVGFVMIDIIRGLAKDSENGIVELDKFIDIFTTDSSTLRGHLRDIEDECGISRGERLSDGFPVSNGPMRIVLKAWLGSAGGELLRKGGLLMQLGILERVNSGQLRVVKNSPFSDLPNVQKALLGVSRPHEIYGSSKPYLGCFYLEETATLVVSNIGAHLPDEYHHMMHVLGLIKNAGKEEIGWDSNFYAFNEVEQIIKGQGHPRWVKRFGTYLRQGNHRLRGSLDFPQVMEFASDRMTANINSTLGGLLGRMKELGLIYPIRSGPVKNVQITPFGASMLSQYNSSPVQVVGGTEAQLVAAGSKDTLSIRGDE